MMRNSIDKNKRDIVCWFSGGITSAVACKKAIDIFGKDRCRVIFIDTKNEDEDTYRFKDDCEKWYGIEIETITLIGTKDKAKGVEYTINSIKDIWIHHMSLNTANGAICSAILKRKCREIWQKENKYTHQAFGFEFERKEFNRALGLSVNHPMAKAIFPLLMWALSKKQTINVVVDAGIEPPRAYKWGYNNNNCLKTGCVQGGIGYWQKTQRERIAEFDEMAEVEHILTDLRGFPVTMCKDQSKETKELVKRTGDKTLAFVFLKPHPDYPDNKDLSMMEGREPEPLVDCNGFCGVNDMVKREKVESELNFIDDSIEAKESEGKRKECNSPNLFSELT